MIDLGRLHSQDVGISGACRIGTAICAGRSLNIKGHSVALICRQRTRVTYREAELHCAVLCQGAGSTDIVHIGQGGIPGSQSASVLPSHRHSGNIRITDVFDLYFHIDGCIVTVLNCLFPRVVSIPSGRTGLRRRLTQFGLQRQRLGIGGIVARICACHLEGEVIACRTSILLLEGGRSRSPVGHIQLSNILIAVTVHHLGTRHQPSGLDNGVTVIVGLGFVDNGFDLGLGFLDFQRHGHVRLLTGRSVRCCNRKCNRTHIVIDSGPRRQLYCSAVDGQIAREPAARRKAVVAGTIAYATRQGTGASNGHRLFPVGNIAGNPIGCAHVVDSHHLVRRSHIQAVGVKGNRDFCGTGDLQCSCCTAAAGLRDTARCIPCAGLRGGPLGCRSGISGFQSRRQMYRIPAHGNQTAPRGGVGAGAHEEGRSTLVCLCSHRVIVHIGRACRACIQGDTCSLATHRNGGVVRNGGVFKCSHTVYGRRRNAFAAAIADDAHAGIGCISLTIKLQVDRKVFTRCAELGSQCNAIGSGRRRSHIQCPGGIPAERTHIGRRLPCVSIVLIIVDCRQRIHRILDRTVGRCPQQHHGIAGCCGIAATCAAGAVLHIIIIEIMGSRCAHIDAGLLIVSYCNCVGPGGNQYTDAVACGIHSGRTGKGSVADLNQLAVP